MKQSSKGLRLAFWIFVPSIIFGNAVLVLSGSSKKSLLDFFCGLVTTSPVKVAEVSTKSPVAKVRIGISDLCELCGSCDVPGEFDDEENKISFFKTFNHDLVQSFYFEPKVYKFIKDYRTLNVPSLCEIALHHSEEIMK